MEMISESKGHKLYPRRPLSPPPHARQPPGSRRRFRQEIYYADGGRSTRYLASDDDDAEVQGVNDSPGTRRYTFEEKDSDQLKSSDHSESSGPQASSLSLPSSSQDDPIMEIVPPAFISATGSQRRSPSLEV